MASITQIPTELLLQIISELDEKAISAISWSCKALRRVVHPFLHWKPSYEFITPHPFLLRTFIEKSPLNKSIKNLGFTGRVKSVYHRTPGTLWNADSEPELTASEFDAMRHLVRATELPEEELWFLRIRKRRCECFRCAASFAISRASEAASQPWLL